MTNSSCARCGAAMALASTVDSGNAKYRTYHCHGCRSEKTVCTGINT